METKQSDKSETFITKIKLFFEGYFKGEFKVRLWVKVVFFLGLLLFSIIAGLIFGYAIMGDGSKLDALKPSTWLHILDFIRK